MPHGVARDFLIDLRRSFVIGDHPHDVELAARTGATGIYVLSGHGARHRGQVPAQAIVVDGIREAAETILAAVSGCRRAGRPGREGMNHGLPGAAAEGMIRAGDAGGCGSEEVRA